MKSLSYWIKSGVNKKVFNMINNKYLNQQKNLYKKYLKNQYKKNLSYLSEKDKKTIILDNYTQQMIAGLMISDYWLSKSGNHFRLSVEQKQRTYVSHIWNILNKNKIVGAQPFERVRIKKVDGIEKRFTSWAFQTYTLPYFDNLHKQWYKYSNENNKYVKVLPAKFKEVLTETTLAYWIAGDGYFDKKKGVLYLYTNCFTKEEVNILCENIADKLEIEATIVRVNATSRSNEWTIRIARKNFKKVVDLVQTKIPKDFLYKLGL